MEANMRNIIVLFAMVYMVAVGFNDGQKEKEVKPKTTIKCKPSRFVNCPKV